MEAELVSELPAKPIEDRRAELEKVAAGISLSPVSDDIAQGRDWLQTLQAAGFDGVVAKKLGLPYLPGSRDGVVKVKPHKTADCVVAGLRWKAGGRDTIATLLLGLYADDGHLDYVGSCAVGAKRQDEIAAKVLPLLDTRSDRRLAGALGFLPLYPFEQHAQVADRLVDSLVQVAELREARRHRRNREVLSLDVRQLVPGDGRRHSRVGPAAHRVGGENRAVARVLVVVDEHALAALLLPPGRGHELRGTPLDLARECECAAPHDPKLPVRLDPAVHVHAAVAARLRPADVADLVQHLVHDGGDLLRLRERGAGLRVDVDAQLVRLFGIVSPRRPRAELERREIRSPGDVRQLGHAELVGVASGREGDTTG